MSYDWRAPSGQDWTIPVGTDIGRSFKIGETRHQPADRRAYYNIKKPAGAAE
jgi:hypothetical protein